MGSNLGKLIIFGHWLLTNRPTSVALDVTHRCNLKCAHCYWWRQDHPTELEEQAMIDFMRRLKAKGLRAAILYGGEPTLRPRICRAASEIFDATLVFTNGTNGFPHLNNGQWILSLDGPREINDAIRGRGVYDLALRSLFKARRPPIVHMTISRLNKNSIEHFVKEMLDLPIKGIGFSFFTPNRGSQDQALLVPLSERDRLVRHILELRYRYGEAVGLTPAMARQALSDGRFNEWNRYEACPVSKRVRCFTSDGRPKACTYGDDADCSRCGCAAVMAYRGAFSPLDYHTLRVICGLVVPGKQRAKTLRGAKPCHSRMPIRSSSVQP
jgi:MoaA/NifB/PqqE/SkfB family radical SAM enzyme